MRQHIDAFTIEQGEAQSCLFRCNLAWIIWQGANYGNEIMRMTDLRYVGTFIYGGHIKPKRISADFDAFQSD